MQSDDFYWDIIKDIGWEMKTIDYNKIRNELHTKYDMKTVLKLMLFVRVRYFNMRERLYSLWMNGMLGLSDDSYWDFCVNFVGLGKEIYNAVYDRPNISIPMAHMGAYTENFQYIFSYLPKSNVKYVCRLQKK